MKIKTRIILLLLIQFFFVLEGYTQCNVQASICQAGSPSQSFNFVSTSGAYAGGAFANAGCNTGAAGNHAYGFITLYITTSGPLNILINGNASTGFIDVAIFNVPNGVSPCVAIQSGSNAIGCNFASTSGGCVQFGTTFPCSPSVPAPYVNAGDEIMIVAQSYTAGTSTQFNLQMSSTVGSAQSGPPDATINPASTGPFCTTDGLQQISAGNMGGTWSGPGMSANGMFNPAVAGPGVHTINYAIGVAPCNATSSAQITVGSIAMSGLTVGTCQPGGVYNVSGNINISNPPTSGQLIVEDCSGQQTVVASAPFSVGSYPFNLGGLSANGAACDVHAYFTGGACSHILNYTAPSCPATCGITNFSATPSGCAANNTYTLNGSVGFMNAPTTGQLIVSDCNGNTATFNAPFTSPINYSFNSHNYIH